MKLVKVLSLCLIASILAGCSARESKSQVASIDDLKEAVLGVSGCKNFETLSIQTETLIPAYSQLGYQLQLVLPFVTSEMKFADDTSYEGDIVTSSDFNTEFEVCNSNGLGLNDVTNFETSPTSAGVDFEIATSCAKGEGDLSYMGACSDEFAKASKYGYWWIIAKGKSEELAKKWAETETFTETQKFAYGKYAVATVAPFEYLDPASLDLAYLQLFDTGTKRSLKSVFLTRSKDANLGAPKNFTTYVTAKRTPFVEFCEFAPKDILCRFFPDKNFIQ